MPQNSTALTRALISFHSIYFIALGVFSLFFTDIMLEKISDDPNAELVAMDKYFGVMLILAGLFCHDLFRSKSRLIRPLIYLLFYSFCSLYLMTLQEVSVGLGDTYFLFRLTLTILIVIALVLEFLKNDKFIKE